jgi:hypothetical protein
VRHRNISMAHENLRWITSKEYVHLALVPLVKGDGKVRARLPRKAWPVREAGPERLGRCRRSMAILV